MPGKDAGLISVSSPMICKSIKDAYGTHANI
jgi:hypothetical protein